MRMVEIPISDADCQIVKTKIIEKQVFGQASLLVGTTFIGFTDILLSDHRTVISVLIYSVLRIQGQKWKLL